MDDCDWRLTIKWGMRAQVYSEIPLALSSIVYFGVITNPWKLKSVFSPDDALVKRNILTRYIDINDIIILKWVVKRIQFQDRENIQKPKKY